MCKPNVSFEQLFIHCHERRVQSRVGGAVVSVRACFRGLGHKVLRQKIGTQMNGGKTAGQFLRKTLCRESRWEACALASNNLHEFFSNRNSKSRFQLTAWICTASQVFNLVLCPCPQSRVWISVTISIHAPLVPCWRQKSRALFAALCGPCWIEARVNLIDFLRFLIPGVRVFQITLDS